MYQQKVRNRKLPPLKGLLVVLGIAAAIYLDSLAAGLLTRLVGAAPAAFVFWAFGILLALWTMRRFVLTYTYTLTSNLLRITFAYGRYERAFEEIYFNNILFSGDLSAVRSRYPDARIRRATRPGCELPAFAVAARDNGSVTIYLLQPDETIRPALQKKR